MPGETTLRVTDVDVEKGVLTVEPTYDTAHPDYYIVRIPRRPEQDYSVAYWIRYETNLYIPGWRIGGYIDVDPRHWSLEDLIEGKDGLQR